MSIRDAGLVRTGMRRMGSGNPNGTGSNGQVVYWTGPSTIAGEANLFWDATNNRLGIGTSSPQVALHVRPSTTGNGTYNAADVITAETTTVTNVNIHGPTSASVLFSRDNQRGAGQILYTQSTDTMDFFTNAVARLRLDANGSAIFGTNGFARASSAVGDVILDNASATSPAVKWYYTNNGNWAIDVSSAALRVRTNSGEAGAATQAQFSTGGCQFDTLAALTAVALGLRGGIADGGTAIGVKIGNANALSTAGAKILSLYSDAFSTEKFYVDRLGKVVAGVFGDTTTNHTFNGNQLIIQNNSAGICRVTAGNNSASVWFGTSAGNINEIVGNTTVSFGTGQVSSNYNLTLGVGTIASAAGAVCDFVKFPGSTITLNGSTNITTATGFNAVTINALTYSAGSALTINDAASLYIAGPPVGGGAGPATITRAYSLWVDTGLIRYDGQIALGGGAAPTFGTIGGSGPATAAQNSWIKINVDGNARFIPLWA